MARDIAFEEILLYDSPILLPQERKNMTRVDGRANDELRPVSISLDFTESPDASVLVKFGKTIVWCSASVQNEQPRWMKYEGPENKGWVTAEYSMMPGSTSPRNRREGRRGSIGGRTHEIQRLIGRSLRAVTDLEKLGPKTYTIDCDVLQADGGTRTASITGAFVALAIAVQKQIDKGDLTELPFRDSLAAISCGIVDGIPMLDLPYTEDVAADVDMNVVMTGNGSFVEVQGTGEESVFSADELSALLKLAGKGVKDLTAIQAEAVKDYPNLVKFFTK